MSVFWCEGCQQSKDSDFVEFEVIDDKWYCEDCRENMILINKQELLDVVEGWMIAVNEKVQMKFEEEHKVFFMNLLDINKAMFNKVRDL